MENLYCFIWRNSLRFYLWSGKRSCVHCTVFHLSGWNSFRKKKKNKNWVTENISRESGRLGTKYCGRSDLWNYLYFVRIVVSHLMCKFFSQSALIPRRPCWVPRDGKLLSLRTETRSQTFQLEARGTKSIVYGQYGRRERIRPIVVLGLKYFYNYLAILYNDDMGWKC